MIPPHTTRAPDDPAGDRPLAARAAAGDSAAIEQLYDRYEKRLFNYCLRVTSNPDDAADATQEAFCGVIQHLPRLDVTTLNFAAYLFTAARNACLDLISQSKRAVATDELPEPRMEMPLELDPERAILNQDQQRAARAAGARLPERQREALALREVGELSYEDIAAAMQMNSNAVAQLISRARLNFFKQLRAASVVVPPLDEAGQKAIELAAARQDGRIADDELAWLERHLAENEASRINVEAMHESTLIYRAIPPVAVAAGLRNETVAKAAELLSAGVRVTDDSASRDTESHDCPPSTESGAGGAESGPRATAADAAGPAAARRAGRRTAMFAAAVLMAVFLALQAAGGLDENQSPTGESSTEATSSGETAARTTGRRARATDANSAPKASTGAPGLSAPQAEGAPRSRPGDGRQRRKRRGPSDEQPGVAPLSEEQPQSPPPTADPPPQPTSPAGEPTPPTKPPEPSRPPIEPPNVCGKPPCDQPIP